jgi:hypothetical protein
MAKLEIEVLIGAASKEFLVDLTAMVDRLEAAVGKVGPHSPDEVPDVPKTDKKTRTKKAAPVVEEEQFDLSAAGFEDDQSETEEEEVVLITNDEFIARCSKKKDAAIKMMKRLGLKNINLIKPQDYKRILNEIGA